MKLEIAVLKATVLSSVLKKGQHYSISLFEEVGVVRDKKYFEFWLLKFDVIKKEIVRNRHLTAKEIKLIVSEDYIEKAEAVSLIQSGMTVFFDGQKLKVFRAPPKARY